MAHSDTDELTLPVGFEIASKYGVFEILNVVGKGNFAQVYKVKKVENGGIFALKILNSKNIHSFLNENNNWAKVSSHKNILKFYDSFIFQDRACFLTEFVEKWNADSADLEDWFKLQSKNSDFIEKTIKLFFEILQGLQYIHENGVLHMDIKPANILLKENSPRIADFGTTRKTDRKGTETQIGSRRYLSPKLYVALTQEKEFKIDIKDDLWASTVTFYELLTGNSPFINGYQLTSYNYKKLPDSIAKDFDKFFEKGFSKETDKSFSNAKEMTLELLDDWSHIFEQLPKETIVDSEFMQKILDKKEKEIQEVNQKKVEIEQQIIESKNHNEILITHIKELSFQFEKAKSQSKAEKSDFQDRLEKLQSELNDSQLRLNELEKLKTENTKTQTLLTNNLMANLRKKDTQIINLEEKIRKLESLNEAKAAKLNEQLQINRRIKELVSSEEAINSVNENIILNKESLTDATNLKFRNLHLSNESLGKFDKETKDTSESVDDYKYKKIRNYIFLFSKQAIIGIILIIFWWLLPESIKSLVAYFPSILVFFFADILGLPDRVVWMICLIFSLTLPIVRTIYMVERKRLADSDDIKRHLKLPTLALIPHQSILEKKKKGSLQRINGNGTGSSITALFAIENSRSAMAEAYRHLRTSLLFSSAGKPPQTILVTSSQPFEGKTTTAINTAITLAQTGADVVIIDCDLRRPRLHSHFAMDNNTGLTNYLSGERNLRALLKPFPSFPRLKVITSGPIPPNPAELLSSQDMKDLIRELKGMFKHIIVDSPPAISFTDAAIISTLVDAVVIVVMANKSDVSMTQRLIRRLESLGARIYGVILNGVMSFDYYPNDYSFIYNYNDEVDDDDIKQNAVS